MHSKRGRKGSKACACPVPDHEVRIFLSWFCGKQIEVAKQRFTVSQLSLGLPLHSRCHPASRGPCTERTGPVFPTDTHACWMSLAEQAHASHHSLGDHSDLDTEDPCLFAGGHSLQAELPARELDGEFYFNLQRKGKAWVSHALWTLRAEISGSLSVLTQQPFSPPEQTGPPE